MRTTLSTLILLLGLALIANADVSLRAKEALVVFDSAWLGLSGVHQRIAVSGTDTGTLKRARDQDT